MAFETINRSVKYAVPGFTVLTIGSPVNPDASAAAGYQIAEMHRIMEQVASISGQTVGIDDLRASIRLYNEIQRLIRRIYASMLFSNSSNRTVVDDIRVFDGE